MIVKTKLAKIMAACMPRSRCFWFWFSFVQSVAIWLNIVGTDIKGSRWFGFPFTFVVYGYDDSWWGFEPLHLFLNLILSTTAAVVLAWAMTAWRFRNSANAPENLPSTAGNQ